GSGSLVFHESCPAKRSEGGSDPLRIHEDLAVPTYVIIARLLRVGPRLLGFVLLASPLGCSHERHVSPAGLVQRILPPVNLDLREELPVPRSTAQETSGGSRARLGPPRAADDADAKEVQLPTAAPESGAT